MTTWSNAFATLNQSDLNLTSSLATIQSDSNRIPQENGPARDLALRVLELKIHQLLANADIARQNIPLLREKLELLETTANLVRDETAQLQNRVTAEQNRTTCTQKTINVVSGILRTTYSFACTIARNLLQN